jgi:hypothetical protein
MAKTDAEILDGSPIDITFNGKTYTWRPLSRRKQRRVRAELLSIMWQRHRAQAKWSKHPRA